MIIEVATPAARSIPLGERVLMCAEAVLGSVDQEQSARARVRLANCLNDLGAWEEADKQLQLARKEAPKNPSIVRAVGLMQFRKGALEEGIRLYDQGRFQLSGFEKFNRPYAFRPWQGQDLSNKQILVWAEQGVGDQVMYARVLHDLVERGALVSVECDPRLIPLFKRVLPTVEFKTQSVPLVAAYVERQFDFQVSMFSAWRWVQKPGRFHETLRPSADLAQQFRQIWLGQDTTRRRRINIGLSWSSKAAATGAKRTISPEQLSLLSQTCELSGIPVRFHNLQYDDRNAKTLARRFGAPLWTDEQCDPLRDLDRQCAQIKALDLVISIDNATVHLAGAMGVPTWVLLPKGSEYRWGMKDQTTDLYPSLRLFRSRNNDVWGETIYSVAEALKQRFAKRVAA